MSMYCNNLICEHNARQVKAAKSNGGQGSEYSECTGITSQHSDQSLLHNSTTENSEQEIQSLQNLLVSWIAPLSPNGNVVLSYIIDHQSSVSLIIY